ncbi:hypothetical protein [Vampirovibrio sp.]|uniref:hypothetical protein n=1 Tax=Vampirovibrio sp. TaxID=2717857 RepID=UPI0035941608
MAFSTLSAQDRMHHIYQKLQDSIEDENVVGEIMVDIKTLLSQAVAERTGTNRNIDQVSEVFGNAWWNRR